MKIDVLCANDGGSPLGVTVKDIYGEGKRGVGIGGSEIALLTLCESWAARGDEVVLYNNPLQAGASPFEQRAITEFRPEADRDVLIVFRVPNQAAIGAKGLRVFFSCDQYTSAPFEPFFPLVHRVVTISPFHHNYFKKEYHFDQSITIDLPIRVDDYTVSVAKVPSRCIFTSVPDRGLDILFAIWPLIQRDVRDASLVITSDYRLWGVAPNNEQHRLKWLRHVQRHNVEFIGAVPRRRLVEEQLKAQVHTYPCTYQELFCISVAESQIAGAVPVTSTSGALPTTNMGMVINGRPTDPKWVEEFVFHVKNLLTSDRLALVQDDLRQKAIERFHPNKILEQWDEKVFR